MGQKFCGTSSIPTLGTTGTFAHFAKGNPASVEPQRRDILKTPTSIRIFLNVEPCYQETSYTRPKSGLKKKIGTMADTGPEQSSERSRLECGREAFLHNRPQHFLTVSCHQKGLPLTTLSEKATLCFFSPFPRHGFLWYVLPNTIFLFFFFMAHLPPTRM